MIRKTIEFLGRITEEHLENVLGPPQSVSSEEYILFSNVVSQDLANEESESFNPVNKILMSVINLEEERIFKSQSPHFRNGNGQTIRKEPDIKFNVYILFAANFKGANYLEGLGALEEVIAFFQANNVFHPDQYPDLAGMPQIAVDLYTQSLDRSYEFWQSMGGKFLFSVIYRVRGLYLDSNQAGSIGQNITQTRLNGGSL